MKTLRILWPMVAVVTGFVLAAHADQKLTAEQIEIQERTDLATKEAIGKARKDLMSAPVAAGAAIVVLPFYNDANDIVRDRMKNAVTACGKTCVEDKGSAVLEEILKEIAWDERKQDVLDPATVVRFGRLKGAQYLLYGGVIGRNITERYVLVELEFHLTEIATKKHVWGGSFSSRIYANDQTHGQVDIPADVRRMLRTKLRSSIAESLAKSNKLKNIRTVAILPLSADKDGYLGGFVRDVVSASALTPVELDVRTRAEARYALREGAVKSDAIFYGTVRDFSASVKSLSPMQSETHTAEVEVQLWIENGTSREILWSDTLAESVDFSVGPEDWWTSLCKLLPVLRTSPWLVVVVPLGILIGLIVLVIIVKNATRVR